MQPVYPVAYAGTLDIVKLLQSQKIKRKCANYVVFKLAHQNKEEVCAFMTGVTVESISIAAIPFGNTLCSVSGYAAAFLDQITFGIRGATQSTLCPSIHFNQTDNTFQRSITRIIDMTMQVEQTAPM